MATLSRERIVRAILAKLRPGVEWEIGDLFEALASNRNLDPASYCLILGELEYQGFVVSVETPNGTRIRRPDNLH